MEDTVETDQLDVIAASAHEYFSVQNRARERALPLCRQMIQNSGNAIRAAHRLDPEAAQALLEANRLLNEQLLAAVVDSEEIRQAGFAHDAQKEYAEACITFALIRQVALPQAADIGVPMPAYLNGLGEAVGEMRRYILDSLRRGDTSRCEALLSTMDDIYSLLMAMDYPDMVTHGLRRNSDAARGLIERTRGDLTNALRQDALEARLADFQKRIC
jgi:translin